MESLKAGEASEDFYKDGRVAFFAKGQIQGKWLLTTSYDTANPGPRSETAFSRTLTRLLLHPLRDSTQQNYDAASARSSM